LKAQNLKEAYKVFDPTPLRENMKSFYIKRGENLVKLFSTLDQEPVRVLFSGHRGSGKTTELNYTEMALASKYSVFNLKVGKYIDFKQFDYRDSIIAILKVLKDSKCYEYKKPNFQQPIDVGLSRKVSISESIANLNNVIKTIERKAGKNVLLLIDDLDKSGEAIEKILLEKGAVFNEIDCSLVVTVPITVIYSKMVNRITEWFPNIEVLPNITVYNKDNSINREGLALLKELVLRRMNWKLINDKALEKAIFFSGGVFRYLVKIIQDSAFNALRSGKNQIEENDVENSIMKMRSEFGRIIGLDDYETLKKIHQKKNLTNIPKDVRLIANDIVLEYQNDTRWVDIHPIVTDLLPPG
jgi:hypothetical protein